MLKALAVAVALLGAAGCASMGQNFDESRRDQLVPGLTTESAAIRLLGAEPTSRTYQADGSYQAEWSFLTSPFFSKAQSKILLLDFDKDRTFVRLSSYTE